MTPTLESLGIDKLSPKEKMELAYAIWYSVLPEEMTVPRLTADQKRELDRRIAEDDANPEVGTPWEEVKAELLARRIR